MVQKFFASPSDLHNPIVSPNDSQRQHTPPTVHPHNVQRTSKPHQPLISRQFLQQPPPPPSSSSQRQQVVYQHPQSQVIEPPPRMRNDVSSAKRNRQPLEPVIASVPLTPIQNLTNSSDEISRPYRSSWHEADQHPPQPPPRRRSVTSLNNIGKLNPSAGITATPMVVGHEAKFSTLEEQSSADYQKVSFGSR